MASDTSHLSQRAGIIGSDERTEGSPVAHAKDKGEKHVKKAAQKSIKEKRAQKKAKKQALAARPE
jgi:hypothetical protein